MDNAFAFANQNATCAARLPPLWRCAARLLFFCAQHVFLLFWCTARLLLFWCTARLPSFLVFLVQHIFLFCGAQHVFFFLVHSTSSFLLLHLVHSTSSSSFGAQHVFFFVLCTSASFFWCLALPLFFGALHFLFFFWRSAFPLHFWRCSAFPSFFLFFFGGDAAHFLFWDAVQYLFFFGCVLREFFPLCVDTPNRAHCEVRVGQLLCVRCGEDPIFHATTAERIGCSSSMSEDSTLNKDTGKHTHPCQYVRATQQHTQQAPDTNSHGNQQRLSSHLGRFQTSNTVSRDQTAKRQLHESQCECSSRVARSTLANN